MQRETEKLNHVLVFEYLQQPSTLNKILLLSIKLKVTSGNFINFRETGPCHWAVRYCAVFSVAKIRPRWH